MRLVKPERPPPWRSDCMRSANSDLPSTAVLSPPKCQRPAVTGSGLPPDGGLPEIERGEGNAVVIPSGAGLLQRLGDLERDGNCLFNRDRASSDAFREILPLDQFHCVIVDAAFHTHGIDTDDVRMFEHRGRTGLVLESLQLPWIEDRGQGKNLERYAAIQ